MAAMSIFFIVIIASNARFATPGSGSVVACMSATGVICHDKSPSILAPAALTLLAAVADNRVPVAIRFGLIVSRNLKRKCFRMLECGSSIQAKTGDAQYGEFNRQDVTLPCLTVSRRERDALRLPMNLERFWYKTAPLLPHLCRTRCKQYSSLVLAFHRSIKVSRFRPGDISKAV